MDFTKATIYVHLIDITYKILAIIFLFCKIQLPYKCVLGSAHNIKKDVEANEMSFLLSDARFHEARGEQDPGEGGLWLGAGSRLLRQRRGARSHG